MTEASMAYHEDVRNRKDVAKSAAHKNNGSAVQKLGNKQMSWQEIRSRHGQVNTYDLDGFMSYDEFKGMPSDLKVEYVNKLCAKYHVRVRHISEFLFEAGDKDLMAYLKVKDLYNQCKQSNDWTDETVEKFKYDISNWKLRDKIVKNVDNTEKERRNSIIQNAEFVSYEEFCSFENDEQVDYLNSLITRYGTSLKFIESELFGLGCTVLRDRLKRKKIYDQIIQCKKRGLFVRKNNDEFKKLIDIWKGTKAVPMPINVKPEQNIIAIDKDGEDLHYVKATSMSIIKEETPVVAEPIVKEETPIVLNESKSAPEVSFSANYISEDGLDQTQLSAIFSLFKGKKVSIGIDIHTI